MRRSRWVSAVVVFGLTGALVGAVPEGVWAVAAPARCRATAYVANADGGSVSTIDVKTTTKNPTDIFVRSGPIRVAVTPDGKTAFVGNFHGYVSTIDVNTRTKNPTDIPIGAEHFGVKVTPDGKTAFVTNTNVTSGTDSVSTIDVKTRTKNPTDIPVGENPNGVAFTPCRR